MMEETLYDALIEAKVSQEKARAAAKAVADQQDRFNRIERALGLVQHDVSQMKWMLGYVITVVTILLVKVLAA